MNKVKLSNVQYVSGDIMDFLRLLPNSDIHRIATVLVFRHNNIDYVVKSRLDADMNLEEYEFAYIKKTDSISNEDFFEVLSNQDLSKRFILYDISGYKLSLMGCSIN